MHILLFTILGLFIGSFLNVCIDRLPRGESIVFPPSYCESCNHKLSLPDLFPVFSYLFLRGKCRYCRGGIPLRIPIVEMVTAGLFGLLAWHSGLSLELAFFLVYVCLFILIFVIDLENQLVLNVITYPAMVLAFAFSFFRPDIAGLDSLGSGAVTMVVIPVAGEASAQAVISLMGGILGFIVMSLPYLVYAGGMGMGDIKLAFLVGLILGYPLIILTILISWILGGVVAGILLAFKIKGRKDAIPAAVFMAVAALVTLLWGQDIWMWYF
ncbi:MAG: prepilin peptidase [Dehalococcoidales bacterium]|nr:prepilin peptidase [Dehalococcoidales bacterium]